jgi:hypothetical protein
MEHPGSTQIQVLHSTQRARLREFRYIEAKLSSVDL